MNGKVKWFNATKGYGFITNDETGDDVFFHCTNVNGYEQGSAIADKTQVVYDIENSRKGTSAIDITIEMK